MVRSMTGFGAGRSSVNGEEISVEVCSVSHKYCDVRVRLPRELGALEHDVVRAVKERLTRGSVEVEVRRMSPGSAVRPRIDLTLAESYARAFADVRARLGLKGEVTLANVIFADGVVRVDERAVDLAIVGTAMRSALAAALSQLEATRAREGREVERDLRARLDDIEKLVSRVARLGPTTLEQYRVRVAERVARLNGGVPIDPARMAQEFAVFADRTDVAEEIVRIESHASQVRAQLSGKEPVGRKLEFLVQEMHREANTMGSKSRSAEIAENVVALKVHIERMREEVQEIE